MNQYIINEEELHELLRLRDATNQVDRVSIASRIRSRPYNPQAERDEKLETWLVSELQESQNMLDNTIFEDDIFEHEIRCEIKDYSRILKKMKELREGKGGEQE